MTTQWTIAQLERTTARTLDDKSIIAIGIGI